MRTAALKVDTKQYIIYLFMYLLYILLFTPMGTQSSLDHFRVTIRTKSMKYNRKKC